MKSYRDPPSEHDRRVCIKVDEPFVITGVSYFKEAAQTNSARIVLSAAFKAKWGRWKTKHG